jgi:uncharacterized protein
MSLSSEAEVSYTSAVPGRRPVLDFHMRLAPRPAAATGLLELMDRCRIDRAVVCAGGTIALDQLSTQLVEGGHVETDADNDAVLAGCAGSAGRLVPFFFANPHRDADEYRSRTAEFRGLEISPAVHGVALANERVAELVSVAEGVGHPVYVVCLARSGSGVIDLVRLAERFPSARFVLGHSGIGNIDLHALNLVAPHANISVETSGGYTCVLRAALDRLGADRVLFGSEYPLQHPTVELAKFAVLDLSPECWQKVAWRNGHRLIGDESGRR